MKNRQISSSGSFTSSDSDLVEHQLSRKRRGKYFKKRGTKNIKAWGHGKFISVHSGSLGTSELTGSEFQHLLTI